MPVAWSGENLRAERNLYGRDIDESNNYKQESATDVEADLAANAKNYYAPFKDGNVDGIKAGYAKQGTALETERTDSKDASHVGTAHWSLDSDERGKSATKYKYEGNTNISAASKLPYALIFKDPDNWQKPPSSWDADDLVPNDSRMYITKLVLWKLLENSENWASLRFGLASTYLPTTNDSNFSDSDNHTGLNNRFDFNGMYKVKPFGSNVWTSKKFIKSGGISWPDPEGNSGWPLSSNLSNRKKFSNGVLTQAISGNVRGYNAIHAQYYPMWSHQTVDPLYSSITGGSAEIEIMQSIYKLLHRGSLLVPIRGYGDIWSGGTKPQMAHVDRVRQWINGFADLYNGTTEKNKVTAVDNTNRKSQWHYYKDPEIGVAGTFILPHAIYPDPRPGYAMARSNYLAKVHTNGYTTHTNADATAVWYSNKANNTDYRYDRFASSTELENDEQEARNRFNSGSGEAAGTILDFFSPPKGKYSDLGDISYPIRSACEPNWVIVITTGQELKPALEDDDGAPINSYTYTAAQAIKNLYDATDKSRKTGARTSANDNPLIGSKVYAPYEQVSMLPRSGDGTPIGSPEEVDLDKPIRTLVVGIVPDIDKMDEGAEGSTEREEYNTVKEMYVNLKRMAVAGQGGNPDEIKTYDDTKKAEFRKFKAFIAENPDGLTEAILGALTVINDSVVVQPGSGVMPQSESLDDLEAQQSDLYSYQYRVLYSDQWEATVTRDVISMDADGTVNEIHKWTVGEEGDPRIPMEGRNVRFWKDGWGYDNLVQLNSGAAADFGKLSGLTSDLLDPPPGESFGDGKQPYNVFDLWYHGVDYSYDGDKYERLRMFTDLGQGGAVIVSDPVAATGDGTGQLPGYNAWAEAVTKQDPVLYAQTNDGLLRVIDPTQAGKGNEIMAIIPPPMLVPPRLAPLKAKKGQGGKMQMLNVTETGGYMSYPAFTLDGSLQKRNFDLGQKGDGTGWGKYLLGALGRGGSGLYMLDVSDHVEPNMMWYRETNLSNQQLISTRVPDGGTPGVTYLYSDKTDIADNEKGYLKLGFNSPKPAMGVASLIKDDGSTGRQNFIALAGGAMPATLAEPKDGTRIDLSNNGNAGATLLMIEPKDGSIIKAFDSSSLPANWVFPENTAQQGNAPAMGMMVSEPTLFRSGTNPYLAGGIIAADNRGNIFRIDMDDPNTYSPRKTIDWSVKTLATLQAADSKASTKSYAIPHGVVVGMQGQSNNLWLAGGTADIKVQKREADSNDIGILRNDKQMIFSFMSNNDQSGPYTRDDFKYLDPGDKNSAFRLGEDGKTGWYSTLQEDGQNNFREYVSTKPLLINGTLFVATFIQKDKIIVEDPSICEPGRPLDGDSRLYAVDIATGKPTTWTGADGRTPTKYETFEHVKIASLVDLAKGGKGKLMIRFDILSPSNNLEAVLRRQPKLKRVVGSTTDFTIEEPEGVSDSGIPAKTTIIDYWVIK
jgi:hypothetical protein